MENKQKTKPKLLPLDDVSSDSEPKVSKKKQVVQVVSDSDEQDSQEEAESELSEMEGVESEMTESDVKDADSSEEELMVYTQKQRE